MIEDFSVAIVTGLKKRQNQGGSHILDVFSQLNGFSEAEDDWFFSVVQGTIHSLLWRLDVTIDEISRISGCSCNTNRYLVIPCLEYWSLVLLTVSFLKTVMKHYFVHSSIWIEMCI